MRKLLLAAFSVVTLTTVLFSQGSAQLGGVVTDPSAALLPGVSVTVVNTETSVTNTTITNESGAYNFASLQPGALYRVSASLPGFQTKSITNLSLSAGTNNRQDFQLAVATAATTIDVQVDANSVLTAAGASVGDVLPAQRVQDLPLVGGNVLDLLEIMPGLRKSPAGEQFDTIGGLGINSVNVTLNGMPTRDERFNPEAGVTLDGNPAVVGAYTGGLSLLSTTTLSPDLVGEIRLILAPVDAELGRGNSQVQITTRSGTNKFAGSAVWNVRNTALNANTWANNRNINSTTGQWDPRKLDWRNTNQYTISFGGPVIKDKTFFFALWDQQFSRNRQTQENRVLTETARQGIFRYWEGWVADSGDPVANAAVFPNLGANPAWPSVDALGHPLAPPAWPDSTFNSLTNTYSKPYTGRLVCFSVFGTVKADGSPFTSADCSSGVDSKGLPYTGVAMFPQSGSLWDSKRPNAAQAQLGYFSKILAKMPHANDFITDAFGDGLNYADHKYLLVRHGNNDNQSIVGSESQAERKQINIKIDQNFKSHRISGGWTYQADDNIDNIGDWPGSYSGKTYRRPQTITINATSTLSSTLLNEARFGINYDKTRSVPAWLSPDTDTATAAQSYLLSGGVSRSGNGKPYPVVVVPQTTSLQFAAGVMETCGGSGATANCPASIIVGVTQVGYTDPLYNAADTVSWTHGKHAFKFGGDFRFPRSNGFTLQPYPTAGYGNLGGTATASPFASSTDSPNLGTTGTPTSANPAQTVNLFPQDARTLAGELAYMFTNSIGFISTPYWAENSGDVAKGLAGWQDTTTQDNRHREMVFSDFAIFAKDDYKLSRRLTLNLGLRYEYYSPPYITSGLTSTTVDQGYGLFGSQRGSGSPFDTWLQPGNMYLTGYGNNANALAPGRTSFLECVPGVQQKTGLPVSNCNPNLLTNIEYIGPNSPNPGKTIIPRDKNNFGPAIGFAWQVPWFGEGRTSVRGGYQVTYSRPSVPEGTLASAIGGYLNQNLGVNDPSVQSIIAATAGNRALLVDDLPALVPLTPGTAPGGTVPVYSRSQSVTAYDPNYATPYTQTFTLSVTRNVTRNFTMDVRWVGTMSRKQAGNLNLNTTNVFYNPELLDALERTRKGENVDLFDRMLAGLDLNTATGYGRVGTCTAQAGAPADGYCAAGFIRERGSEHLRRWNGVGGTAGNLANGNYAAVIGTLLGTNAPQGGYYDVSGGTGLPSGITSLSNRTLRNGCDRIAMGLYNPNNPAGPTNIPTQCFPEDYFAANSQLNNATYNANLGRSSHHQLQVQMSLRPTHGFSFQSTYTWAKAMQIPGSGYTDPLQRNLDRRRGQEAPHSFRTNGTFELPIGPNKLLFPNASGWVARLIERWQTSFILNLESGSPGDISGAATTRYANPRYVVGNPAWKIPKGHVEWGASNGNQGRFFGDDQYIRVVDPQCTDAGVIAQTDSRNYSFASSNCTLVALAARAPVGTAGSYLLDPNDPSSTVVNMLVNPKPGELGTLGPRTLSRWGAFSLDANVQKTFRINESKQVSIRVDATNILNHPQVDVPNFNVASTTAVFGAITGKTGSRTFQGQVRLSF